MIEVVTGRIGGGKTCMAIYRMAKYIAEGGCVYTNITLRGLLVTYDIETQKPCFTFASDAPIRLFLRKRYEWEIQDGQYHLIEPESMDDGFQTVIAPGTPDKKVLIVLDEVNEWFDSLDRDKARTDKAYRLTLRFLRQSRKVYTDVMFILQDFQTLNSRIRGLVGYMWICRDMEYFSVTGVRLGWLFKRFFVWQRFDGSGRFPNQRARWIAKDKDIFALYDTTEIFGDTLGVLPAGSARTDFRGLGRIQRKVSKMNNFQFACLLACMGFSAFTGYLIWSGKSLPVSGVPQVIVVTNQVGAASAVVSNPRVMWAPISYGCAGSEEWAYVDGNMYRPGMFCDRGRVVEISKYQIRIVGDDGDYFILHREPRLVVGQVAKLEVEK